MFIMLQYASSLVSILRDLATWFTSTSLNIPLYDIFDKAWTHYEVSLPFGFTVAELVIGSGLYLVLSIRVLKFIYGGGSVGA